MLIRKTLKILLVTIPLAACSGPDQEAAAPTEPAANADQPVADTDVNAGEQDAVEAQGRVFIQRPVNGASVISPFPVEFGIEGFAVAPAGTYDPQTGHHHLLINTGLPPLDQPIPADENHVHFGKGQTSTTVELPTGEHTLQLLLGDGNHVPHNPPLASEVITIMVVD